MYIFPHPLFYHSINQLLDILKKTTKRAFILRCRAKKYQNIYDEIKFNLILHTPSELSEHIRNPHILGGMALTERVLLNKGLFMKKRLEVKDVVKSVSHFISSANI